MAEEKTKTSLEKIEKLILDGNKEVLGRLDKLEEGQRELGEGQRELREGQQRLDQKVERISKTLDATAQASYSLLTDVQKDVKEVKGKLEEHTRQPAHA